jgi:hypothetical protein
MDPAASRSGRRCHRAVISVPITATPESATSQRAVPPSMNVITTMSQSGR